MFRHKHTYKQLLRFFLYTVAQILLQNGHFIADTSGGLSVYCKSFVYCAAGCICHPWNFIIYIKWWSKSIVSHVSQSENLTEECRCPTAGGTGRKVKGSGQVQWFILWGSWVFATNARTSRYLSIVCTAWSWRTIQLQAHSLPYFLNSGNISMTTWALWVEDGLSCQLLRQRDVQSCGGAVDSMPCINIQ